MTQKKQQLKITLVRSPAGRLPRHNATLRGLGLSKLNQTIVIEDNPCMRGMVKQVAYLLKVEG